MKLGVIGLPNVGKSTLFNAITKAGAEAANYPFCTIEPNIGVVTVPDRRLDNLAKMYNPEKYTPATIEFVDIAGLVRGASKGEGLGNKFLSHIREVDAIVHVVRCFRNDEIIHVDGTIDPIRDTETVNLELILSDLETVARRIDRTQKNARSGNKSALTELELLERTKTHLENELPIRSMEVTPEEKDILDAQFFLTGKPVIYVANISEEDINSKENPPFVQKLEALARKENAQVVVISARIEEELSQLSKDEKDLFLEDIGLTESGLDKLVKASYKLLGLISYLTAGPKEVRAWTIPNGTKAPQAAGKIHTDFERGFIRAEVIAYVILMEAGTYTAAKEAGFVRSEGKDYVMKDGDVVLFRFNV